MPVDLRVPGSAHHGVVRHAASLRGLLGGPTPTVTHTQFTDALWGPDVASAAEAFVAWAATARRPLVVTLHDVPGDDPDPARDTRRTAGYARVAAAADAVVLSSEHEAVRARGWGADPVVVPLPLPALPDAEPVVRRAVAVLGFVYPGKGHAEAVDAAAPHGVDVVALGGAADGHADLLEALHRRAADRGVRLEVTGPLSDAELAAGARGAAVPVSAHRSVSASGSLLAWLAAGRRPLVVPDPYSREVAVRAPGSVHLVDDLVTAVGRALADPAWTRGPVPAWPDVAQLHRDLYDRLTT